MEWNENNKEFCFQVKLLLGDANASLNTSDAVDAFVSFNNEEIKKIQEVYRNEKSSNIILLQNTCPSLFTRILNAIRIAKIDFFLDLGLRTGKITLDNLSDKELHDNFHKDISDGSFAYKDDSTYEIWLDQEIENIQDDISYLRERYDLNKIMDLKLVAKEKFFCNIPRELIIYTP